jgi:hypothetical protein
VGLLAWQDETMLFDHVPCREGCPTLPPSLVLIPPSDDDSTGSGDDVAGGTGAPAAGDRRIPSSSRMGRKGSSSSGSGPAAKQRVLCWATTAHMTQSIMPQVSAAGMHARRGRSCLW